MNFSIEKLEKLSGVMAGIYSIHYENDMCPYLKFFNEFSSLHKDEFQEHVKKLSSIARVYGVAENNFNGQTRMYKNIGYLIAKPNNGRQVLRLYCALYDESIIIIGGGGYKPVNSNSWQKSEDLSSIMNPFIQCIARIDRRIALEQISINKSQLKGNLSFYE